MAPVVVTFEIGWRGLTAQIAVNQNPWSHCVRIGDRLATHHGLFSPSTEFARMVVLELRVSPLIHFCWRLYCTNHRPGCSSRKCYQHTVSPHSAPLRITMFF